LVPTIVISNLVNIYDWDNVDSPANAESNNNANITVKI